MSGALIVAALTLALSAAGSATAAPAGAGNAVVPAALLARAQANPGQDFSVIVQGSQEPGLVASAVTSAHGRMKHQFESVNGVSISITGADLVRLADDKRVLAITPDSLLHSTDYQNAEMWRMSTDLLPLSLPQNAAPAAEHSAIAIIDSGIQPKRFEFRHRVRASVNFSSLSPGAEGDDEGHGTMVAALAAAQGASIGADSSAPLVDVRTANAQGESLTSDVIAACDWLLAHKEKYDIRVANMSFSGRVVSSFATEPLDRAVEKLWLNGIVVVTAAGNQGTGSGPVPMTAPANDPFVITVGALDQHQTSSVADDTAPPWSAYGHTLDGFAKPELSAPGRYLIGPVPAGSTLCGDVSRSRGSSRLHVDVRDLVCGPDCRGRGRSDSRPSH